MNVMIVSEDIRRANSRAVARRDRWRSRYEATSMAIRKSKGRMRMANRSGQIHLEREELVTLQALRVQADLMMAYRQDIAQELRDTAYRYAPREAM